MSFTLPTLPYAQDALAPTISAETIEYHHGKHHNAYLTKLNDLVTGTDNENKTLEEIVQNSTGVLFNQAAQVWNHTFYFTGFKPNGGGTPTGALAAAIDASFGSFDEFKTKFAASAGGNFGSGWTWLVKNSDGSLEIVNTDDADTPLREGKQCVLTVDVWEHAYYVDYRNARPKYVESLWSIIDWDVAAKRFD